MTARRDAVERILAAARRSFLDVGVERTRMVDIAALAVISRPQLYRYFPTKEHLHVAVVTCEARRLSEEFLVLLPFEGSSHEIAITRILGGLQRARSSDILVPMMRSDVARRTAILGHYDEVVARSGRGS